jgi:hypothetical protein
MNFYWFFVILKLQKIYFLRDLLVRFLLILGVFSINSFVQNILQVLIQFIIGDLVLALNPRKQFFFFGFLFFLLSIVLFFLLFIFPLIFFKNKVYVDDHENID